jgi:hypothetical protein
MELERVGEVLRLERLGTDVARHVQRIADHHPGATISAYEPGQGAKVRARTG